MACWRACAGFPLLSPVSRRAQEGGMSKGDISAVERIIANIINETARGDPDALAARIVAALAEAGFRIVSADGRANTALGPHRSETSQLYRSPNGDSWFLVRDPETGSAFVRHHANAPSGGQMTDIELGAFLSASGSPEHEALLRLDWRINLQSAGGRGR